MPPFYRAILFILLAILLFDIQGAIIKHLGSRYPVPLIATYRNIFGLLPSILVLVFSAQWQAGNRSLRLDRWWLAVVRGIAIAGAQFFFYLSITRMEFATATTLAFAGPLFITALSVPILGSRVGLARWSAVVIGFSGIVMVMRPGDGVFHPAAILPIIAAFGYGLSSVLVRLFDPQTPTATINIYTTLSTLTCSILLVGLLDAYQPVLPLTDWLWLAALGIVGGFAVFFLIVAYRLTEPGNLSPFEYFGIPFSFAIGWIFFNEAPFGTLFPGVIFIVAGGLIIVWRERSKGASVATQAKTSRRH